MYCRYSDTLDISCGPCRQSPTKPPSSSRHLTGHALAGALDNMSHRKAPLDRHLFPGLYNLHSQASPLPGYYISIFHWKHRRSSRLSDFVFFALRVLLVAVAIAVAITFTIA